MPRKIEMSAAYARLALQSGVAPAAELLRGVASTEEALADAEFIDAASWVSCFAIMTAASTTAPGPHDSVPNSVSPHTDRWGSPH